MKKNFLTALTILALSVSSGYSQIGDNEKSGTITRDFSPIHDVNRCDDSIQRSISEEPDLTLTRVCHTCQSTLLVYMNCKDEFGHFLFRCQVCGDVCEYRW